MNEALDPDVAPEGERPPALLLLLLLVQIGTSSLLTFEPSLCDALFLPLALATLLTARSVSTIPLGLGAYAGLLLLVFGNLASLMFAPEFMFSVRFAAITIYLLGYGYCIAVLVGRYGAGITGWMYWGYTIAALTCCGLGLLVQFGVLHFDSFYRDSSALRLKSTFKDPNVFGPFLVAAILWTLSRMLERRRMPFSSFVLIALYLLGILFSFSRGAWLHLGGSLAVFCLLHFLIVRDGRTLSRLSVALAAGLVVFPLLLAFLLTQASMGEFFERRMAMQDYDSERFSTQMWALRVSMEKPFGVGSGSWSPILHDHATHNLYIRTLVENGWLGAVGLFLYLGAVIAQGLRVVVGRGPTAGLQAAMLGTLAGIMVESVVIDTMHWRHLFLVTGTISGLYLHAARGATANQPAGERPRPAGAPGEPDVALPGR